MGNTIFVESRGNMRILVIHNFYQHAGGEDAVFRQEVEELKKEHRVDTLTFQNKKGWRGALQFLSCPWNIRAMRMVKRHIRSFAPDVVHIHNVHYASGPAIIRCIHQQGVPMVMTLHNFRLLCPSATLFFRGKIFTDSIRQDFPWTAIRLGALDGSPLKTGITAFTYWLHRKLGTWDLVSRYIVLSDFAKARFLESTFPVPTDRFVVRPNSIDAIPKTSPPGQGFIYIGRLSEEKGIVPLLQAIAHLPFSLAVYGSGPQQDRVEHFAREFPNISYYGQQARPVLDKAIAAADALIVPSVCFEGMPLTIIEAYAQGTPVLASNIGILKKMVVPLSTGMHFNPHDKSAIQRILTKWVQLDAATKQDIRENCTKAYLAQYTVETNMKKLTAIYEVAIQQQGEKQ